LGKLVVGVGGDGIGIENENENMSPRLLRNLGQSQGAGKHLVAI
jgi:hypothetical protein